MDEELYVNLSILLPILKRANYSNLKHQYFTQIKDIIGKICQCFKTSDNYKYLKVWFNMLLRVLTNTDDIYDNTPEITAIVDNFNINLINGLNGNSNIESKTVTNYLNDFSQCVKSYLTTCNFYTKTLRDFNVQFGQLKLINPTKYLQFIFQYFTPIFKNNIVLTDYVVDNNGFVLRHVYDSYATHIIDLTKISNANIKVKMELSVNDFTYKCKYEISSYYVENGCYHENYSMYW